MLTRNAAFVKGSVAYKMLGDSTLSDLDEMHSVQYEWLVGQYQSHDHGSWDNSEFSAGARMTLYDPSASEGLISSYSSGIYFVEDEEVGFDKAIREEKSFYQKCALVCH